MNMTFIERLQGALSFFVIDLIELSVLFIGVSFLVEILNLYLSPAKVQKALNGKRGGYFIAAALGAITPFCSCSSIPITVGLLKARASFGAVMTFLFTSPLLNPIVFAVFWSAFGLKVTLFYSLFAFFVSIFAGFTLAKFGFEKYIKTDFLDKDSYKTCACDKNASKKNIDLNPQKIKKNISFAQNQKFSNTKKNQNPKKLEAKKILKQTWKQFLSFLPYIVIGIAIGAFVHDFIPQTLLSKYANKDNPYAVVVSAFIGVPLYIRAAAMVGLAPALIAKGVSMGSILALTIAGAGTSLPEMVMLKKMFKAPIMIFFILSVFIMAIACGLLVNLYFS